MITFMVVSGFSLLEVKKLYLDEFVNYYQELFYTLEKRGEYQEGTYDKLVNKYTGSDAKSVADSIKKQLAQLGMHQ